MLKVTQLCNKGTEMPEFFFFRKGNTVKALPKSDLQGATQLKQQGYQKLFEEVNARDEQRALARLADIKKEEEMTVHAFMTWPVVVSLVALVCFVIAWLSEGLK